MAWVKLDDQAPRHAKMLKAGPAACWLWVCGIAHCQSQLTDGYVSIDALPMIGIRGEARCVKLAEELVKVGLFDKAEDGYMVHGYLDHNPSRSSVLAKRAEDAERKRRGEESARTPKGLRPESGAPRASVPSHPIPTVPIPAPAEPSAARRSAGQPPLALGLRRLKIWRWMVEEFIDRLGDHADSFDLDAWIQQQDRTEQRAIGGDWGAYWTTAFNAEIRRRGIPLASTSKSIFTESAENEAKAVLAIVQNRGGLPR